MISLERFSLQKVWILNVQTPDVALPELISAIECGIELRQGNYSRCMYVRRDGLTRFKNENGAHGGAEDVVRQVTSAEIIITLPYEPQRLTAALHCIAEAHVHEEPTIHISEGFSFLAGPDADRTNQNRYWNRADSATIHGEALIP